MPWIFYFRFYLPDSKKIMPCMFYFRFYLSDSKTEQNWSLWLHPYRLLPLFLRRMPVQERVPAKARHRYLISSVVALRRGFWDRVSRCLFGGSLRSACLQLSSPLATGLCYLISSLWVPGIPTQGPMLIQHGFSTHPSLWPLSFSFDLYLFKPFPL